MPTSARILTVDDVPGLSRLYTIYLSHLGYEVDACSSGPEALEIFKKDPKRYALVLADLTMPDMSGDDLLQQLVQYNPRSCVVICSGAPFDLYSLPSETRRQIRFVQKPFRPDMLAQAIEEILQKSGPVEG